MHLSSKMIKKVWVNTHTCKLILHHMLIIYWMNLQGLLLHNRRSIDSNTAWISQTLSWLTILSINLCFVILSCAFLQDSPSWEARGIFSSPCWELFLNTMSMKKMLQNKGDLDSRLIPGMKKELGKPELGGLEEG